MNRSRPPSRHRARLAPGERSRLLVEISRSGPLPAPLARDLDELRGRQAFLETLDEVLLRELARREAEAEAATREGRTEVPPDDDRLPQLADPWGGLGAFDLSSRALERNLIITAARKDPAHAAFDVLRTRTLQALSDNGWRRIAVTSPTKGCGKTFTALNLAIAMSRHAQRRIVLLDLDLRQPALWRYLGTRAPGPIADMLRGLVPPERHLRRFGPNPMHIGKNLALGLNEQVEPFAAELMQSPELAASLEDLDRRLRPDVVLFDLPPVLALDDVIALRPRYDCVLMVLGGGQTTPREVREATRRLGSDIPLLGLVLNRGDGAELSDYSY